MGQVANKAIKADAIDSAALAHGFAILCASAAPLLHRLWRRYLASFQVLGRSFKAICQSSKVL